MQQAPSTSAATATEAIEEDASLPEETQNNIAKMVHSNSEDKENPTQPSSQIKQKGSSKKKNEKFADENSAKAIISAFGSACAPPGAFSQSNEKSIALSAQAFQNAPTTKTKQLFGDATSAMTNISPVPNPQPQPQDLMQTKKINMKEAPVDQLSMTDEESKMSET